MRAPDWPHTHMHAFTRQAGNLHTRSTCHGNTTHRTTRSVPRERGILQVQSVQRDSHVPRGYKTSPLARARYLPEVPRVRSPRSSNWLRLCPPTSGRASSLRAGTHDAQTVASPARHTVQPQPGKSEPTRGDNFVAPPVYLHAVSRPVELSLQSSLQLSLTVLVCYRSRRDI